MPGEVASARLRDLLVRSKDGDWGKASGAAGMLPYRVIRGTDFPRVRLGDTSSVPVRYLSELSVHRRTLEPEDILLETAGGSSDRPTGRTVLIPERLLSSLDFPATCASFARFLRVDRTLAEPRYVYWFLQYLYASGQMEEHQVQHTGVARFQYTRFAESQQIPLPERGRQRAIADILSTLDDRIELNRRMNETLEATARAIFKSWFVDFEPVRGTATVPGDVRRLFPDRLVNSPIGLIPNGWQVASLGALFPDDRDSVLTGPFGSHLHASDYSDAGVPLVLVKHVVNGRILDGNLPLVNHKKAAELSRYRLTSGDIVFTRVGAVGRSAFVGPRFAGWLFSGQTLRVRVPDWSVVHPRYLAQLFLEDSFRRRVEGSALGTTRPSLNTGLLRGYRFLVPPAQLLRMFAEIVGKGDSLIDANEVQSRTLAELRDTLLPKLVSGEITVGGASPLEPVGPASPPGPSAMVL